MTIASIDIGTNTVLLLVADIDDYATISTRIFEQRIPRLGKDVDIRKTLAPDSMTRVINVLIEYRRLLASVRVDRIVVCGTSAVRDAVNRETLVGRIRQETGFELEVLSGEDEAIWAYRGALTGMQRVGKVTVIDIGGGSTEISVGDREQIRERISLDIGSVRLTERFFRHDPPTHPDLEAAIELIENELQRAARFSFSGSSLVGVAGTVTTLAVLAQGLPAFDITAVTNYHLMRDQVDDLFRQLRAMPSDLIRTLSSVMDGRHDVIVAGILILREIMAHFAFEELLVSERGLRYGLVLREWERTKKK
jgi:exopolyphosphatase/guanosine-5'-triphosphate,3'-diphosphate pyrophosphatase